MLQNEIHELANARSCTAECGPSTGALLSTYRTLHVYIRVTTVERKNVKISTFSAQFQAIYLPVLLVLQKNKTLQLQAERKQIR
jgi:hypothetical protein